MSAWGAGAASAVSARDVVALYACTSVLAFVAYGIDKAAARRGTRRIPETTLHLLSLLGGWPGALLAQRLFHHKTRKQPFRRVFWATVAANVVLAAALSGAVG